MTLFEIVWRQGRGTGEGDGRRDGVNRGEKIRVSWLISTLVHDPRCNEKKKITS